MTNVCNWIVRIYRAEKVVKDWTIKDRTEREAEKEAMGDPRMRNYEGYANFDWTLSKEVDHEKTLCAACCRLCRPEFGWPVSHRKES